MKTSELVRMLTEMDPIGDREVTLHGPSGMEILGNADIGTVWFDMVHKYDERAGDDDTVLKLKAVCLYGMHRGDTWTADLEDDVGDGQDVVRGTIEAPGKIV